MSTQIPLDRFLRYDEYVTLLQTLAAARPELVTLESIGRSHEGRDIWLLTITDSATGQHHDKPAMWVDANIHATELTAGVAALALVDRLLSGYGTDTTVTRAVQTRTFYVVPRLNPDGVEAALADRPNYLRSSTRFWPWTDGWRRPGAHVSDLDGDGRVLMMRIADPDGQWRPHRDEPRLLVGRGPADGPDDGPYYRLLIESEVEDYDGFTIPTPAPTQSLDLNRNYPAGWGTGVPGSGDHPGSEPEVAAAIGAMRARPNICGFNAYHTAGGVLLRPSSTKPDSDLPYLDLMAWKQLGEKCTELSGYPVHSVFEDFTLDKRTVMAGASDDWAYEHLGVHSWTTEFWDVQFRATGTRAPTTWWYFGPPEDLQLGVLRWFDQRGHDLGDGHQAFVDWYPFEHPQLGPVELGGWDSIRVWSNPPLDLLEAEVRPHADFAVHQALAAPCLALRLFEAVCLGRAEDGTGVWRVRAGVANTGWLPTAVTARALAERLVLPLTAEIGLPEGALVLDGPDRIELGQLGGGFTTRLKGDPHDGTPDRALATWLVRARAGDEVTVVARHPRAGTVRGTLTLT